MGVNKVEYGSNTLVDLTGDTVTPETLLQGETAHNAAGDPITGTARPGVQTFNGRSGSVLPIAGDYSAEQVNYDSNQTVKQKIDALATKEASDIAGQQSLLKDTVGWTGKNLLKNTASSQTINGVTFTVNADKSVTVNGTATANTNFYLAEINSSKFPTSIIVSSGVANNNAYIFANAMNGSSFVRQLGNTRQSKEFSLNLDYSDYSHVNLEMWIVNGTTVNNLTFYPMIRRADILDDTYEPYHESVETMYEEEIHGVNLFNVNALRDMAPNVEFNKTNTGIRVRNTSAGTWRYVSFWITNIPKNTECLMSCDVLITSGKGKILVKDSETQASVFDINVEDGETFTKKFNTGNYNSLYLTMYCATDTAELGDVTYNNLMIRKANIEDSTYRPYNPQAIQNQLNAQGVLGAKNLLRSKNTVKTVTTAGITFTVNDDGSITANGTATADAFYEYVRGANDVLEKGKSYIASTGQTANGGLHVYYKVNDSDTWIQLASAVTEEKEFFLPSNANFIIIRMFIGNGNTVSNKVYYPMLRLASDPDDTYQPYAMTNRELTESKALSFTLSTANAILLRNESKIKGDIVSVRVQLQVTSEIASGTELIRKDGTPHVGLGVAVLGNTNTGNMYETFIASSSSNLAFTAKNTIPTGYYALNYTYIQ